MSYPVYYVEATDTLPHLFGTYGSTNGESITMSGLAVSDIEIYKDGSMTQRASDSGYTLIDTDGIDVDGVTGIHGFTIDLSDNSDAGFYAVGSWYHVVVSTITVDSQTVSFVACAFRIISPTRGMSGTALPDAAADAAGGLAISDTGAQDLDAAIAVLTALTAASAAKLAASAGTIVIGTVSHDNTAASVTAMYSDDVTESTADHYNGRIVIFTSGALSGQATRISDYELVSGEGKFTYASLTEAPADNVTFVIV